MVKSLIRDNHLPIHVKVVLMGAWDSLKGQRSKLQGYMSESVQSDIKLSFKCILFSDFCVTRLVLVKATSHAMSKMILTLTSVAHYQLFLYLNKNVEI